MEIGNVINVLNQPKTPAVSIMDLGKQLLENAREGHTTKVHDLMCRGAPFTTDWVCFLRISTKLSPFSPLIKSIIDLNCSWVNQRCIWLLKIITSKPVKHYFGQVSVKIHEQKLKGTH